MALYLIALSKKAKVDIGDAKPLYNGVKAFEDMELSGTIEGLEIKAGLCYGKLFAMDDPSNECNDVHLALLGDFSDLERQDATRFFSAVVEAVSVEEYPFLAGHMVRYNGGAKPLALLVEYQKRKSSSH